MKITQLNHVGLHVTDVDRSVAFYTKVLGLAIAPRPAFGFPGAWFQIGEGEHAQEVHLICREIKDPSPPRERHYAFMVDDIDAFAKMLTEQGIEHRGPKPRPDGAQQIFLRDPDDHVIELCTPPMS